MELSWLVVTAGALWWALCSTVHIGSIVAGLLQPWARRRQATRQDQPPISVVIPVKQLEPEADAAFAATYAQSYPAFELIIAAAEETSPAIEAARRGASRFPSVRTRFITNIRQVTPNPKVSSLACAISVADHDLILVKDSNIRLADGQLAEFVRHLTPGVGLVCALSIAVSPKSVAADIECAMMNGHHAPLLLAASALGWGIGFGKIMLFERDDFLRAGGSAAIAHTFGDDQALAKALASIGLRTVFAASVVRQVVGRRSLRDVWDRQLRWMVIRRTEEPFAFYVEPFFSGAFAAVAGSIGAPFIGIDWWLMAAVTLAGRLSLETLFVAAKGWGWSWRFPLAGICRELLIPALWLRTWFAREVRWGGVPLDIPRGNT